MFISDLYKKCLLFKWENFLVMLENGLYVIVKFIFFIFLEDILKLNKFVILSEVEGMLEFFIILVII